MNLYNFFTMKRLWFGAGVLLIMLAVLLLFGTISKNDSNQLVVGVMSGYVPFAQFDEQGNLVGFDIDVAVVLARKLNKKLVIKDMNLAALLISLQQNKIDLVLSGLCITPERQKVINMVYYQGTPTTTFPLVFWKQIPKDITTIEDLKKYPEATVCVEPGSAQESFLLSFDFLNLRQISNPIDCIMDIKYGKSLAVMLDPDIFPSLQQKNLELKVLNIQLPQEFQSKGCGIAINKENKTLVKQVSEIITELKSDGTLKTLEQKWFGLNDAGAQ
jgi:ABC-type amino acid transport substrate-binding protein